MCQNLIYLIISNYGGIIEEEKVNDSLWFINWFL